MAPPTEHEESDAEKGALDLVFEPRSSSSSPLATTSTHQPTSYLASNVSIAAPSAPHEKLSNTHLFFMGFNLYRRLFAFIVTLNLIGLLLASINKFPYAHKYAGSFVLGNILVAILVRNEFFLRLLYLTINTLFAKWPPLWFRLGCSSFLLHIGGIHSGCASSGFFWLIYRVTNIFLDNKGDRDGPLIAGILTNMTLAISIASAFPWIRSARHNVFERHHRFVGWIGLAATWVFVILDDMYNLPEHIWNEMGLPLLKQLLRTQNFYYVIFMTVLIALPWCTVHRVKVAIEIPSPSVVIMRFDRGMQHGLVSRISRGPVLEYHPFGTVSEGPRAQHHYLICGSRGDYTKKLMANPPSHVWTRQLKFPGVSHTSPLYKRGIRLCTGTGLGSALSTCIQNPNWYLIWLGSDQEKNFGPTISQLIQRHVGSQRATIWDSKKEGGRPDTIKLLKAVYDEWNAEVVFITSSGAKELLEGCALEGMHAFGTLEDF